MKLRRTVMLVMLAGLITAAAGTAGAATKSNVISGGAAGSIRSIDGKSQNFTFVDLLRIWKGGFRFVR